MECENFLGDHIHLFGDMRDLGKWGNSISSLVILAAAGSSSTMSTSRARGMGTLGPGMYANVADKGLKSNSISSVRLSKPAGASPR